jgi:hypothetical protein
MKKWILALGALTILGSACNPVVLDPLQGTLVPDPPGGGASGSTVLAMRGGDASWQPNVLSPGVGSPVLGGVSWPNDFPGSAPAGVSWLDPDTLVLFFSSDAQECSNPLLLGRCVGATPFWQILLAIPPELYRDGPINLADVRINGWASFGDLTGTLHCGSPGTTGPVMLGTLTLTGAGSSSLSITLDGVQTTIGEEIPDGVYTPLSCGGLPPASPPTPALAIHGAADSLILLLGTLPDTCQDPWAAVDCHLRSRLSFTLPLALQMPGIIDLADPAIAATYTIEVPGGNGLCAPPAGPLPNGTIEILSSDAGGLTFKVYRSSPEAAANERLAFDGLYSASICP